MFIGARRALAQYTNVFANLGTYTVTDGEVTRRPLVALNPAFEGREVTVWARLDGDDLVTGPVAADNKAQSRYRRVR